MRITLQVLGSIAFKRVYTQVRNSGSEVPVILERYLVGARGHISLPVFSSQRHHLAYGPP